MTSAGPGESECTVRAAALAAPPAALHHWTSTSVVFLSLLTNPFSFLRFPHVLVLRL